MVCALAAFTGVRVQWIDDDWEWHSVLLSSKPFRPSRKFKTIGGKVLSYWFVAILQDFGIDPQNDVFSFTTDKGPDVWKMCTQLVAGVSATVNFIAT
eukprot:54898-Eustigmatos_ZCMA.PRE.1